MKYLICVTNRVGSSWLCSMLTSTGVAGYPVEHFNLPPEKWPRFREHYRAISQNDPLGIKTSYQALMRAIAEVGSDEFRNTPCIWLRRRDTCAQAISNYRAILTGQWFARRDDPLLPVTAPPDQQAIRRLQAEYEHCNEVLWPAWFREMGITPLSLWYEDMQREPERTVRDVCQFLRLPDPQHVDVGVLRVQRDATSEQWREALMSFGPASIRNRQSQRSAKGRPSDGRLRDLR